MPQDRFARLRDNLAVYREVTAQSDAIAWCVSCEMHHAPHAGGLCPICASEPERVAA